MTTQESIERLETRMELLAKTGALTAEALQGVTQYLEAFDARILQLSTRIDELEVRLAALE